MDLDSFRISLWCFVPFALLASETITIIENGGTKRGSQQRSSLGKCNNNNNNNNNIYNNANDNKKKLPSLMAKRAIGAGGRLNGIIITIRIRIIQTSVLFKLQLNHHHKSHPPISSLDSQGHRSMNPQFCSSKANELGLIADGDLMSAHAIATSDPMRASGYHSV